MVGTSPERQKVMQAPGEFVAAVSINRLKETKNNPDIHGQDMEIARESTPSDGAPDSSESEQHDFNGGSVFCSQTKRRGVLVVNFVDGFVERTPVESTVKEIMPGIFHHEENGNLIGHGPERREGNGGSEAEILSHRVEEPENTSAPDNLSRSVSIRISKRTKFEEVQR